jgi:hypothetical protein
LRPSISTVLNNMARSVAFGLNGCIPSQASHHRPRCFHDFVARRGIETITPGNAAAACRDGGRHNRWE